MFSYSVCTIFLLSNFSFICEICNMTTFKVCNFFTSIILLLGGTWIVGRSHSKVPNNIDIEVSKR